MSAVASDVIVVGAGAAGLTAAWHLENSGWSVTVLEAHAAAIGGRLRKDDSTFAGLDVDLGGEWIHGDPANILNPILGRNVAAEVDTVRHTVPLSAWDGSEFYQQSADGYGDYKWADSTWWDFFNDKVAAELDNIVLGCAVTSIDYGDDNNIVTCKNGDSYAAGTAVVVTVSMTLMQQKSIQFIPTLPAEYIESIDDFQMAPGLKVFMEFEEKFFPQLWEVEKDWTDFAANNEASALYSDRVFYDETFGQTTNKNIIGLFSYGASAERYLSQSGSNEDAVENLVLADLDAMFDGKATATFVRSVIQIWSKEKYVGTGYTRWVTEDNINTEEYAIDVLQEPINNRVFFAGEALPVNDADWGFVHEAALSGKAVAQKINKLEPGPMPNPAGNLPSSPSPSPLPQNQGFLAFLSLLLPCFF